MDEVGGDSKLKILSISLRIKSSIRTVEFCQRDLLDDAEKSIGACFLVDDKIYPPELESIISIVIQSKAAQWCRSPLEYIKSLEQIE